MALQQLVRKLYRQGRLSNSAGPLDPDNSEPGFRLSHAQLFELKLTPGKIVDYRR
jgi:hypothetical protein